MIGDFSLDNKASFSRVGQFAFFETKKKIGIFFSMFFSIVDSKIALEIWNLYGRTMPKLSREKSLIIVRLPYERRKER